MTEATELCPSLEGVVILSKVKVKVPQSCLTLCDPMDNSPGQNTGVGSFSLLQGIFPTQGLNPGIPHCKGILYQLSHKGSPRILEWVSFPFSSRSSLPRNRTGVFCVGGRFFTNWAIWEVPLKTYWERQKSYQGSPVLSKAGLCSWGQKPERDGRWRHLEAHSYRRWNKTFSPDLSSTPYASVTLDLKPSVLPVFISQMEMMTPFLKLQERT